MDNKNCGYLKGDRVKVIGISGHGTVVKDQDGCVVVVKWDDSPSMYSRPMAENLQRVGYEAPVRRGPHDMQEAMDLVEAKKAALVKERNSINSRIVELDEALNLLKG